ncbi:hypothetical protein TKK_0007666 [Trichogramma kaykai]|uniref:Anaphase-promoting complex subunit 2 n=1 Tax=Trichogramma kaykai TaxID=54128 RepID=A0ABD2X9B9_9HYME
MENASGNAVKMDQCIDRIFREVLENISSDNLMNSQTRNCLKMCPFSLLMMKIEKIVRIRVVPQFWSKFNNSINKDSKEGFQDFTDSVDELYENSKKFISVIDRLKESISCVHQNCEFKSDQLIKHVRHYIQGTILSQIPLQHTIIIEQFYKTAFNVFCNIEALQQPCDFPTNNELIICEGCKQEKKNCRCQVIVNIFHKTNEKLIDLGLLERLSGSVLTSLIHIRIKNYVFSVSCNSFNQSQIGNLEHWLDTVVMNWLVRIYTGGSSKMAGLPDKFRNAISTFKQKLSYFLYETYTRVRIQQLFNIILIFPDSQPALDDLRVCLKKNDLRKYLISNLQFNVKTRLLHPGVSTPDILTTYISAIKALRQLDPTCTLLEIITDPVKLYLRGREDTVRCVVSGLLNESNANNLANEIMRNKPINQDLSSSNDTAQKDSNNSTQTKKENWENWQPDLIDSENEFDLKPDLKSDLKSSLFGIYSKITPCKAEPNSAVISKNENSDLISMLVNVYGSQDLFVNEYRSLLADRLLSQLDFQTEKEYRQLQLLKERFGEQQLLSCEVMIKDLCDSQNINNNIHNDQTYMSHFKAFDTSALILSAQFWPPFKEDWKLELPAVVQQQLQKYVLAFESFKANRSICWKTHIGNVNLEIETQDRKLTLNVSPIHATIIIHFQDKNEWSLDQLSEVMHVPTTVLRRKIGYWVSQSLLIETSNDVFVLVDKLDPDNSKQFTDLTQNILEDDEDIDSAMASVSDQREEELQIFWSYIVGMLTNLDSMPLERIHQMLKMFASQGTGAVECSLAELRQFLDNKVKDHQLLYSSGLYKLPKS